MNWFPSPPSPSAKDTGLGKTGGGEAVGTILSWKESSVGSGGVGPKKPPLVLSTPKMSESDADRVEEAVKDFKRVSTYVVRSSLQAAGDLFSHLFVNLNPVFCPTPESWSVMADLWSAKSSGFVTG